MNAIIVFATCCCTGVNVGVVMLLCNLLISGDVKYSHFHTGSNVVQSAAMHATP